MKKEKKKKAYFIGIKGMGMSALAGIYQQNNWIVSGSDVKEKFITDDFLRQNNIKIYEGL